MSSRFSDIQNHWARQPILKFAERNLISGYPDGTFRPDASITRAEVAVLLYWSFPAVPVQKKVPKFKDVPDNHWAKKPIQTVAERGFISGYPDGNFKPEQPISRLHALLTLANGLKYTIPKNPDKILQECFDDARQIPNYAKGAIASAAIAHLIVNYPNLKRLQPNQNATRAEVVAFLCQALKIPDGVPAQYIPQLDLMTIGYAFDDSKPFSEGFAAVKIADKWGYTDKTGNIAIAAQFANADSFRNGLAAVQVSDRWGYINKTGTIVIPTQFEQVDPFQEGLARVKLEGKWGYINSAGKLMIPTQFEEATSFSEGLAAVRIPKYTEA